MPATKSLPEDPSLLTYVLLRVWHGILRHRTIDAADGTKLTFAFYAIGPVRDDARAALDTLTTAVYACGDNLANS